MDIFKIEPFDLDLKKRKYFLKNLNQLTRHHYKNSFYKKNFRWI